MKTTLPTHMSHGNIMAHRGFSPENCTHGECQSSPVHSVQRTAGAVVLEGPMLFEFDDLVYRMVDKHDWPESKARSVFKETKRFLANAAVTRVPLAPTKDVDEVWHNFILYTREYAAFCERYFGKFIHHVPKRRGEILNANCQSGNCDARSCITPAG